MLRAQEENRAKTELLEKYQHEIQKKDAKINEQAQTITNLQHQVANLEARLSATSTPRSSRTKQRAPRNLELQSDIRVLIAKEASLGNRYDHSIPFDHSSNSEITKKVFDEYCKNKKTERKFSQEDIEQYCKTYYRSVKQDESRKERGLKEEHRRRARSRKRKLTKFEERQTALKVPDKFTPEELELLELGKFLVDTIGVTYMSSEDSDLDSDDDGTNTPTDRRKRKAPQSSDRTFRVSKLYWESPQLCNVKRKMDDVYNKECLKPAQRKKRSTRVKDSSCPVSTHPPPKDTPHWMLNDKGKNDITK